MIEKVKNKHKWILRGSGIAKMQHLQGLIEIL